MKAHVDPLALAELLKAHDRGDRPGFAVGVALGGRPLFRRGYGLANLDLPLLLTPRTRLRIGSTSKQFTALAVFLLAEEGKLGVDDSIRRHLPDLPDWAEPITVHQLITHTSGMRCSLDLLSLTSGIMSRADALPHAKQIQLLGRLRSTNFAPGTDWSYCNGGYALLTRLIETLSGMTFGEFLRARVFDPLGLYDTAARPTDTDFLSGAATPHVLQADGTFRRGIFGPEIGGEGNLVSSVDDMLRWLSAVRGQRLGSAATWEGMRRSGTVRGNEAGYSGGLVFSEWRGAAVMFHTGHVIGGNSQALSAPDLELDVVVLANSSAVSSIAIANQILEACIDGLTDIEVGGGPTLLVPGLYLSRETGRYLNLVEKEGALLLDFDGVTMPIRTEADGRGWFQANLMKGCWVKQAGPTLEWHEFGTVDVLSPVIPCQEPGAAAVAGHYRSDEVDADGEIDAEGQLRLSTLAGRATYQLVRKGADLWSVVSPTEGWTGSLERDGRAILLSTLRTRRLRFEPTG